MNEANAYYLLFITPPSGARGGLKENGQNPDSGSKNSENQNNDAISQKKAQKCHFVGIF